MAFSRSRTGPAEQPYKIYENIEQIQLYQKIGGSTKFVLLNDNECTEHLLMNGTTTLYLVHYDWGLRPEDLPVATCPSQSPKFYLHEEGKPERRYLNVVLLPPHRSITLLSCLLRIQEQLM